MTEKQKQEAATHAKRAATQGKNAAKNGIRAVEDVVEVAADEVKDKAADAVQTVTKPDPRVVIAGTALFLGGTYLLGRLLGYQAGRKMTTAGPIVDTPVDVVDAVVVE